MPWLGTAIWVTRPRYPARRSRMISPSSDDARPIPVRNRASFALAVRLVRRWGMATKESVLTGLEPRSFWGHFEALTRIARPSRQEEPAIEHVREWADRQGFELAAGRRPEPRRSASRRRSGRENAPTVGAPGAPGHRLRARSFEPERPGGRPDRARPRRRVADRGRDDARRRRRRRDRGDDGAGRGRVAAARAARAADDGGRGGRARGRERARPRARDGLDPDQPRQRGGREADGGLRRQHRHVDPDRGAARAGGRRTR